MKFRPWYRAWPETAALLFGIAWVPLLPRRAVVGLSRFAAKIAFKHANELREIGRANLEIVFGEEKTQEERDDILMQSFQSFGLLVLDIIWFAFRTEKRLATWFTWDESCAPLFADEAQLILVAHYGNWENMGQSYAAKGQSIFSVAAPLKNQSADKIFIRIREKTGQQIIPQQGAARKLLQGLKKKKKLAVLLDQNTKPKDGGLFVDVMGLPAPVSTAPAALAVKTDTSVYTLTGTADAKGHYTATLHEILAPRQDAEDPVAELTQRMTDSMAAVIRKQPGYWCWMYKRWELIPEGQDQDRYPFYARKIEPGDMKKTAPEKVPDSGRFGIESS